ncbi:O-antigen ligase family protein [Streptomyces sp. NPDC050418]|uniref:O-antigen ligase family protein n=1 Tax=Streptomyces sp. NPDC050418 TaxID=3365612 RepID=UPI0037B5B37C
MATPLAVDLIRVAAHRTRREPDQLAGLFLLTLPVALLALPYGGGDVTARNITPADAASALLVAFCAVQIARGRVRPLPATAAWVLAAPTVALTVATVTAVDPAAALPGLVRYLQIFVLVPAAVVLLVRDAADFRWVASGLVLLAVLEGAVGLHQFVTGTGASYAGQDIRAVGTFGATDVMGMATVVALGLVTALGLAVGSATGVRRPGWQQPALVVTCAALCVPLVLSFSRGAWIATVLVAAGLAAFLGRRRLLQMTAVTVAFVVVLVGGFGVGSAMLDQRLTSITQVTDSPDQSVTDRYTMWAAAADMWRERPVTGVGLKGFPQHRDGHAGLALSSGSDTGGAGQDFHRQPLLSPHSMYLLVLGEQGLVGMVGLAGSWLAVLVLGLRAAVRARLRTGELGVGLVAVGLLAWQLVDFVYADIGGPATALVGIVFGLAVWWACAERPGTVLYGTGRVRTLGRQNTAAYE